MSDLRRIRLAECWGDEDEKAAVMRVIDSGHWSQGEQVERLEQEFAALVGAKHAVAVSSCTAAMELAVIYRLALARITVFAIQAPTFPSAWNACPLGSWTVLDGDPFPDVPKADGRVRIAMHYAGHPCPDGLIDAATIVDCAHALGLPIGRARGWCECWSFHGTKGISCGEGGMLTTDDQDLAEFAWAARRHNMVGPRGAYRVAHPPTGNYAMSDLAAALLRVQLGRVEDVVAKRRVARQAYHAARPDLVMPLEGTYLLAVLLLPDPETKFVAREAFEAANIETTTHYPWSPVALQRADAFAARALTIPCHHRLKEHDIERITGVLRQLPASGRAQDLACPSC